VELAPNPDPVAGPVRSLPRPEEGAPQSVAAPAGQLYRGGGAAPKPRSKKLLRRIKETLLMALGRDDDDDYECTRG
jgi:hypothetical protein